MVSQRTPCIGFGHLHYIARMAKENVAPKSNAPKKPIEGLTIHPVERIEPPLDLVRSLSL